MEYGYWLAHARARLSLRRTRNGSAGTSVDPTLPGGKFIILRDHPLIPIGSMLHRRAVGLDRSFNARMTAARPGTSLAHPPANRRLPQRACPRARATSLFTTRLPK